MRDRLLGMGSDSFGCIGWALMGTGVCSSLTEFGREYRFVVHSLLGESHDIIDILRRRYFTSLSLFVDP